jgi:hypothetical protein
MYRTLNFHFIVVVSVAPFILFIINEVFVALLLGACSLLSIFLFFSLVAHAYMECISYMCSLPIEQQ